MCDKCDELDSKIRHYHQIASGINDQLTLDGIKDLIEEITAEKASLHRAGDE